MNHDRPAEVLAVSGKRRIVDPVREQESQRKLEIACDVWGIKVIDAVGATRKAEIAQRRTAVAWTLMVGSQMHETDVGALLNRDRSTILKNLKPFLLSVKFDGLVRGDAFGRLGDYVVRLNAAEGEPTVCPCCRRELEVSNG